MKKVTSVKQEKRGRPETGHRFVGLRIQPDLHDRISTWAKRHKTGLSQAIRALIERGLER